MAMTLMSLKIYEWIFRGEIEKKIIIFLKIISKFKNSNRFAPKF